MMVRLYYAEQSPDCRKVHLGLLEVGTDYQLVHVDPAKDEPRSPTLLALNPNGKVPTLVDDELVLWESNAILWYLAEKYPMTRLIPEDRLQRARLQQLLCWQLTTLAPAIEAVSAGTSAAERAAATSTLAILGGIVAGRATAVDGDVSIADLALGAFTELAVDLGLEVPGSARRWLTAMRARPAWKKVYGERGPA